MLTIKNHSNPQPATLDWPEGTTLQYTYHPNKTTGKPYYIEAFTKQPYTMFTAHGKTLKEVETLAWKSYRKAIECENHEWEARNYRNGAGFCKHCNLFRSGVLPIKEKCAICNERTYYTYYIDWYCEEHSEEGLKIDYPKLLAMPDSTDKRMKLSRIKFLMEEDED